MREKRGESVQTQSGKRTYGQWKKREGERDRGLKYIKRQRRVRDGKRQRGKDRGGKREDQQKN